MELQTGQWDPGRNLPGQALKHLGQDSKPPGGEDPGVKSTNGAGNISSGVIMGRSFESVRTEHEERADQAQKEAQGAEERGSDLQAVAGPICILKDGSVTSMINTLGAQRVTNSRIFRSGMK